MIAQYGFGHFLHKKNLIFWENAFYQFIWFYCTLKMNMPRQNMKIIEKIVITSITCESDTVEI